jgi:4-hydroxy-4-methyl-2-oxoglutarate aldolase
VIHDTATTDGINPLSILQALPSATIHEAQGRTGELPSSIKPVNPDFRLCGPAFTVESPGGDNLWLHRAIYAASPGEVLVVSVAHDPDAGYWGEIMSHAARERSLGGLLINACVRDGSRLAAAGLPVFATGLCIRGTEKDASKRGALNRPIWLGRTLVSPGDMIVADVDGAVVIAADRIDQVAHDSLRRMESEGGIINRIRSGESTLDIYGLTEGDG